MSDFKRGEKLLWGRNDPVDVTFLCAGNEFGIVLDVNGNEHFAHLDNLKRPPVPFATIADEKDECGNLVIKIGDVVVTRSYYRDVAQSLVDAINAAFEERMKANEGLLAACQKVVSVIELLDAKDDPAAMYRLGKPTMDQLRAAIAAAQGAKP